MGHHLTWSMEASRDIREIVRFIRRDSPVRAQTFALRLIETVDVLMTFPQIGRVVPEIRDDAIRELIFRPYRIVYRVKSEQGVIEIVRVWHSARGTPLLG